MLSIVHRTFCHHCIPEFCDRIHIAIIWEFIQSIYMTHGTNLTFYCEILFTVNYWTHARIKTSFFCLSALHRISPPLMSITFAGMHVFWLKKINNKKRTDSSMISISILKWNSCGCAIRKETVAAIKRVIVHGESTRWVWWDSISVVSWIV